MYIDKIVDVRDVQQRRVPRFQKTQKPGEVPVHDRVVDVPDMERERRPSAPRMSFKTLYFETYEYER